MRRTNDDARFTGNSVMEIVNAFSAEVLRLGVYLRFGSAKLKPGHLTNALVLNFLAMSEEERDVYAAQGIARFEVFMSDSDEERAIYTSKLETLLAQRPKRKPAKK